MTLAEVKKAGVPAFAYGNFLSILLNFIILASSSSSWSSSSTG